MADDDCSNCEKEKCPFYGDSYNCRVKIIREINNAGITQKEMKVMFSVFEKLDKTGLDDLASNLKWVINDLQEALDNKDICNE